MKFNTIKAATYVLAGTIFALAFFASGGAGSVANSSATGQDGNSFIKPLRRDFSEKLQWFGKVKSSGEVEVTSLIAGRVESVRAKDGDTVKKNQVLFTLGGQQIANQKKLLKQNIANLTERIRLAKEVLQSKREALNLKLTTKEFVTTAEDAVKMLEIQKNTAENTLKQIEAFSEIRAATSGIYKGIVLTPGQVVAAGQVVAQLISTESMFIEATLYPGGSERKLAGKKVLIKADEKILKGKIVSILPRRNSVGATVVRILAENGRKWLHVGELLRGTVVLDERKGSLCLPERCVVKDEENHYFVFVKSGKGCEIRKIDLGLTSGGMIEIRSGVKEGELVLDKGAYELYHKNFNKTYKVAD